MDRVTCICLIFAVSFLAFDLGQCDDSSGEYTEATSYDHEEPRNYSVVIDVKKMETTISVYQFEWTGGFKLNVYNPFDYTVKNGLLVYAQNPNSSISDLNELIIYARQREFMVLADTPLRLIAAGMRHLSSEQEADLMLVWREYLLKTRFRIDDDSVAGMYGRRKFFSWVSVNLLLGRLEDNKYKTATILELASTSSHMAFIPDESDQLTEWQKDLVTDWKAFETMYRVYGQSNYGLGLNQARKSIIEQGTEVETHTYISECFYPSATVHWVFQKYRYIIQGQSVNGTSQSINVTNCMKVIEKVFPEDRIPPSLLGKEIYVLAYYHQVFSSTGLVRRGENKNITVGDIEDKARVECRVYDRKNPFACMNLLYVNMLLKKMYGLEDDSTITVVNMLKDVYVTWRLGAAFQKFDEMMWPTVKSG